MRPSIFSASEAKALGDRTVFFGIMAIIVFLLGAGIILFANLPDAGAFDREVTNLFVTNQDLTEQSEIKLLEILAQSGTAFSQTLTSYRVIIFVLLIISLSMLIAALVFLTLLISLTRRMGQIEKSGIQVSSLVINRDQNLVYLNNFEFKLTPAATETLAVLAEARMDGDLLSGAEIEAVISGRGNEQCEEAAGATRIKRLRDSLGNQLVSELLVKNVARKGYTLSIDKDVIQMI